MPPIELTWTTLLIIALALLAAFVSILGSGLYRNTGAGLQLMLWTVGGLVGGSVWLALSWVVGHPFLGTLSCAAVTAGLVCFLRARARRAAQVEGDGSHLVPVGDGQETASSKLRDSVDRP